MPTVIGFDDNSGAKTKSDRTFLEPAGDSPKLTAVHMNEIMAAPRQPPLLCPFPSLAGRQGEKERRIFMCQSWERSI